MILKYSKVKAYVEIFCVLLNILTVRKSKKKASTLQKWCIFSLKDGELTSLRNHLVAFARSRFR